MQTKILLIEDELRLADNIRILLEANGFGVVVANDGCEGLKKVNEYLPNLIICDIMMPGMDGYAVLAELSKDSSTSHIPFIFLTAKTEYSDLRKGMDLGANDYLYKPFTARDLLASVRTRLKKAVAKIDPVSTEPENKSKFKAGDSIFLHINKNKKFVNIEDIVYICAERQYTNITFKDGKSVVLRKALNQWEKELPENLFVRISRSTLINIAFIMEIKKTSYRSFKIMITDVEREFEVSRRFVQKLNKFRS